MVCNHFTSTFRVRYFGCTHETYIYKALLFENTVLTVSLPIKMYLPLTLYLCNPSDLFPMPAEQGSLRARDSLSQDGSAHLSTQSCRHASSVPLLVSISSIRSSQTQDHLLSSSSDQQQQTAATSYHPSLWDSLKGGGREVDKVVVKEEKARRK